jgi:hypothetical protein
MRPVVAITVASFVLLTAAIATAQQPEPYQAVGTWKLNPAKSSGSSNMIGVRSNAPPQVGSMTETRVDAHTVRWAIRDANGKVTAEGTRTVAADGKSYRLGDLVYDKQ